MLQIENGEAAAVDKEERGRLRVRLDDELVGEADERAQVLDEGDHALGLHTLEDRDVREEHPVQDEGELQLEGRRRGRTCRATRPRDSTSRTAFTRTSAG